MEDAKRRARATYDAAAESFDDPALSFWDRFGRQTVERLDLPTGATVLDACAGSGASAIPAAQRVGPTGRVLAVDLADNLLALARAKATRLGLANLETRHGDVEALGDPPGSYDAVVIVFGIFFLPDVATGTAGLWRLVAPGGQLAVTTWGPRLWEPASSLFWDAVDTVRPDLTRAYNPWDTLTDPDAVRSLLVGAGAAEVRVEPVAATHPLSSAEDFWTIVRGSGYRATHDALTEDEREVVRARCLGALADRGVEEIEVNVVFADARRPP
jgi:ubiquinone/menaquinone biosynthesis C-methylase UbiE